MIKIAIPNKGSLSETAQSILKEAGYKTRGYSKALAVADTEHDIEFFFSGRKTSPFMWQMANSISVSLAVIWQ